MHHGGGRSSNSNSTCPHVKQNHTGTGKNARGGIGGLGEVACNSQNTLYNLTDGTFRKEEAVREGAKVKEDANATGLKLIHTVDCAQCKGSGKIPAPWNNGRRGYCTRCAGARFVEAEAELVLSIPAGVEKGHTEVYEDKGHVDLSREKHIPRAQSTGFLPASDLSRGRRGVKRVGTAGVLSIGLYVGRVYSSSKLTGQGSVCVDSFQH